MNQQRNCPCGFDSPNFKNQLIQEVISKSMDRFVSKAQKIFRQLSEPITSQFLKLEDNCSINDTRISGFRIDLQNHQGIITKILQDYEPIKSKISNITNELKEVQKKIRAVEDEAQKMKMEIVNNRQELNASIQKVIKNKSRNLDKFQISQNQKLVEISMKKNIQLVENSLEEFNQKNQRFLEKYQTRDKIISQKIKTLQADFCGEKANNKQKPQLINKILPNLIKQLRKAGVVKGKCFNFQVGQNRRNLPNMIKGIPSENQLLIQKTVSDKKQYQYINSVGVSNEECVTYPLIIGKLKESVFIGFTTERTIGNIKFQQPQAAYYCSLDTVWSWGKQVDFLSQTNSVLLRDALQATIDLKQKVIYWKIKNTLLAKVDIPNKLWNQTFYLAVIIVEYQDKIHINLA